MKQIKYMLINGALLLLLVAGYQKDIAGARNCFAFIAWFYFVLAIFANTESLIESAKTKKLKPTVPEWFDNFLHVMFVMYLVWFGAWWTAIAWTVQALGFLAASSKVREE